MNLTLQKQSALALFEQGRYQEALQASVVSGKHSHQISAAKIAALAFLGRTEEAKTLWESNKQILSSSEKMLARFCLGVAYTRVGKSKKGYALFHENWIDHKSVEKSAFAYQGFGFYYYFKGDFRSSLKWSRKALSLSADGKNPFLYFLALDLLGHCTVQLGHRIQGLSQMRNARDLAFAHGNHNFSAAFDAASLVYEAEGGLRPASIVSEIRTMLSQLKVADIYTRNNLLLELARQLTLRGAFQESKDLLNQEAYAIYTFGNTRQEFLYQLRLAEVYFQTGSYQETLHFLRNAEALKIRVLDKSFRLRLLGIRWKVAKALQQNPTSLETEMRTLSEEHSTEINRQILQREGILVSTSPTSDSDPLHDILSLSKRDLKEAKQRALANGYLAIWRNLSQLGEGSRFFYVTPDGKDFLAGDHKKIQLKLNALSAQHLRLIEVLSHGPQTKEKLTHLIWGYDYHPLRHDALVYSALGKLRKAMAPFDDWLITTDQAWHLIPQTKWILPRLSLAIPSSITKERQFTSHSQSLNLRQIRALELLGMPEISLSISEYRSKFQVSTMTAFRDLTNLLNLKLVLKIGRGRATRYLPGPKLGVQYD